MKYFSGLILLGVILLISTASAYPIYVATGDTASIHENIPGGSCWLFPISDIGYNYDFPPIVTIENETFCSTSGDITANLNPGAYTMVYQEPVSIGNKIFRDVSLVNDTLVSSFAKTNPIDISGKQGPEVMNDLIGMVKTNQFNTITSEKVFIEEPNIKLDTLRQTSENVYTASGISNFVNGTPIVIKIDEARYYSQHNNSFVYYTTVRRESSESMGVWSVNMLMPIQEMPPGWHEITIYSRGLITTSQFRVDLQNWSPNPLPTQFVKYLSNGNIEPVYINTTVTVMVNKTEYIDRWLTPTPTPAITDALGENIEYPYKTGGQIPGWVALLAAVGIAGLVLVRDWKWKK